MRPKRETRALGHPAQPRQERRHSGWLHIIASGKDGFSKTNTTPLKPSSAAVTEPNSSLIKECKNVLLSSYLLPVILFHRKAYSPNL